MATLTAEVTVAEVSLLFHKGSRFSAMILERHGSVNGADGRR